MEVSRSGPDPNSPLCQEATDSLLRRGDAEREREELDPEPPCGHCTREMLRGKGMRKAMTTRPRRLAEVVTIATALDLNLCSGGGVGESGAVGATMEEEEMVVEEVWGIGDKVDWLRSVFS
ncbi:hypothetical protein OsJ_28750 [Oryza sativa Japonica Group]|uniref:Uncharacterized protein n=1 Tax=Oryza sativa subsp. japonica TaxID=39947 RepID=Q69VR6_ORYSJ|nr:hypothetical protein OsJ_28750 [Oryza sativa Japonica Group]BAD32979.1 hypothetical protein [Oryza sativa Japonica Group]BAD33218.1 hypothetical protein [Oryza sativa Japonica Group]